MKISKAIQDLRGFFSSKNSLSFIKVKSTISFNLPVLYLGLIKNLYPKPLNQSFSVSVFICMLS